MQPGDVVRTEVRVCESCGYHHERKPGLDVCEACGAALGAPWRDLIQLQSVITRRRERISADEEERNKVGFELRTTYRFVPRGRHPGWSHAIAASESGSEIVDLRYGDTAEIRVTNLGRRNRKDKDAHGFWLDLVKGQWLSEKDAAAVPDDPDDDLEAGIRDVKLRAIVTPYVEDRRNIAVIRWAEPMSESVACTLQFAIERGIEACFQLEDSELTSQPLPDEDARGRVLLVEAAEGGAGVLRRLHAEPTAFARVAAEALSIIHVDAATGNDIEGACVRGCYRCLLSYSNQTSHELIDRRAIVGTLLALAASTTTPVITDGEDDVDTGTSSVPAGLERRLTDMLDLLRARQLRLPDRYDVEIGGIRVDFAYDRPPLPTVVVVERPERATPDTLMDLAFAGWNVLLVPADAELDHYVADHPGVFGGATP